MHVALIGAELEENLAVRYLRGALQHACHRVTQLVFDDAEQVEEVAHKLADSGAELAGMSMVFTWRAREFAALAARARQLGYAGHLMVGGHFAAFHADELLRDVPAIDSVACGEGEELITTMAAGLADLARIDGLVWRDGEQIVHNKSAVKPPDLDRLPSPIRMEPFDNFLGLPIANMLGSRGCMHACAFCSIAAWHRMCGGPRLRLRRPERIADEMAELFDRGVRLFNFHDDNFVLCDREQMLARTTQLASELQRRGVGPIGFAIKSRPDTVDEEVFGLLKKMGMFRVFLGIEAGTAESLGRLGRHQTLQDNERALAIVNHLDLHACFNLLLLNPESTLEDLAANVAFLRRNPHNPMNFCRTEIYSGTPLERQLRRQNRLLGDYWGYDYSIADPRAQAAFEVMFPSFEARNYGEHGLHHRAMHVDYEHQLLTQFYASDDDLRERVKHFIVAVNLNTCDHLEAIIAAIDGVDAEQQAALLRIMKARVEADNDRLLQQGDALLLEIRRRARSQPTTAYGWARTATAAGLAATLTLTSAACDEPSRSHATETIPLPTEPRPKDAGERPPMPTLDAGQDARGDAPQGSASAEPPTGSSALIKPQFVKDELPFVASKIVPSQGIKIELWVDEQGKVSKVMLTRAELSASVQEPIVEHLRQWRVTQPQARGHRFVLAFSADDLTAARRSKAVPHVPRPEMIAPPPRPEMAPRPPRPEMAPRPPMPEMAPRPPKTK